MHIAVCIKQVPAKNTPLFINTEATWINEKQTSFETNEADIYALEEALKLKDSTGAKVTVLTLGAKRCSQVLTEALAKGADQAIHIESNNWFELEAFQISSVLAAQINELKCDLVLTGLQSDDHGYAQTGIMMAEILSFSHISMVVDIQITDHFIKTKKELESGLYQNVEAPLPAVLTIQTGINKPRYANMKGILQAKKKKHIHYDIQELIDTHFIPTQLKNNLCFPETIKNTSWIEEPPEVAAEFILKKLNLIS